MSCVETTPLYDPAQRRLLLGVAAQSIAHGIEHGASLTVDLASYPDALHEIRATFVTLELDGKLRGCIGVLEGCRPLVEDVAHNAFGAAFQDPRFQPLHANEYPKLFTKISVLTPATPLIFDSESDLLHQLRPGLDGLTLQSAHHRGTFLPTVWEQLPNPREFLTHLKRKAGLAADFWSDTIQVSRYTTESFGGPVAS